jgi:membrane associated rhomboid family serine protease
MSNFFVGLFKVVVRAIVGGIIGAIALALSYSAYSFVDAAMGVDTNQAMLGAALIGAVIGGVLGLLYSWKGARNTVESMLRAVLDAAIH